MILAKTCHASKMIQELEKATFRPSAVALGLKVSYSVKAFWIAMFHISIVYGIGKKWIFCWNCCDAQQINMTFVSYILLQISSATFFAKYYLNWFSFHIAITKVIGVDFFETQCTYTPWSIKRCHFYFYDNFGRCGPISLIRSVLDS